MVFCCSPYVLQNVISTPSSSDSAFDTVITLWQIVGFRNKELAAARWMTNASSARNDKELNLTMMQDR